MKSLTFLISLCFRPETGRFVSLKNSFSRSVVYIDGKTSAVEVMWLHIAIIVSYCVLSAICDDELRSRCCSPKAKDGRVENRYKIRHLRREMSYSAL